MRKNRKTRRYLKLKKSRRTYKKKVGGVNCQDEKCLYSVDGKHNFGMVAWRLFRCQNKNEKGEQCPCSFND